MPAPRRRSTSGSAQARTSGHTERSTVDRIAVRQSDTDVVRHDTGAFGSAGTVVAGKAVMLASVTRRP
nr:molybdopterin cofactor-binding domain-containing protein [Streptomyces sp. H27-G5]